MWFYEEAEARKVAALLQQISAQGKALGHTAKETPLVGEERFAFLWEISSCVVFPSPVRLDMWIHGTDCLE